MSQKPYNQILSNICKECKECCHDGVPEGICGFNTIKFILDGSISNEEISKYVVYSVPISLIDAAADKWWHFPDENILEMITVPVNGNYYFLAVPYSPKNCPFLTDLGCKYPEAKPFDCSMFPFHFSHGNFLIEDWCSLTKDVNKENPRLSHFYRETEEATKKYKLFSKLHQQEYSEKLAHIMEKYSLKIIQFSIN